ncbi:tRNA(Met) cytidine acetyltransferase TmcA [Halorubrum aethiopicum]|uniref:tRNA(Met) cytidine acetyltransferase TmcA n=1 Tax=Halorubrum aethiopicum TaxID=1758255 RepID=UPI000835DB4D|nr:tRNA(Met) cytidine acetyltransferase TmcA [Halorubrum aethiopicum]
MIAELAADLKREAERANQRRLLVLAGDRDRGVDAAYDAIEAVDADEGRVSIVSTREGFRFERLAPRAADDLLGRTREVVVLDCHDRFVPNALGRAAGAVDGGGLLVLVTPSLDDWPGRRDGFDESLAVPPFALADVTGRFRERLVETIRTHPGVAVADLGGANDGSPGTGIAIERDGLTDPPAARPRSPPGRPATATFPEAVYDACLTADQSRAVRALESLATPGSAAVVESDRGRGKSSAAGLAAGALALDCRDVLVTAPAFRNAAEVFARAREVVGADGSDAENAGPGDDPIRVAGGGRVRFLPPAAAADLPDDPDCVVVDEAAALPVRLLERFLAAPAIAFCTTVHGYEGAGRGFSVRFRDRLAESEFAVREVRLDEPIRYARDDPVESWVARALLLDARPAVSEAVAETTVDDVDYRALPPDDLLADEVLLGEAFGLLVAAHYRTEPNDLARLLDAPNLVARALVAGDRVVAVALCAREGGLDPETRAGMYEGERVRGNMVPDVLTSQLRDEAAAEPRGLRTVRIAVHHALRGRGLGSRLLDRIRGEFADDVDYLSVGFGATPRLLRFWRRAGYRSVHLSTTRNDASGEHSAVMLRPESEAARTLLDRHASALRDRERDALSDAHRDVDADVVRGVLAACPAQATVDLTPHEWRAVVGASFGPGMYDVAPGAFRDLAVATLLGGGGDGDAASGADAGDLGLDDREERLLVRKVLQGRPWEAVTEELGYVSTAACMRALGSAVEPLVERYGTDLALAERDRFLDR